MADEEIKSEPVVGPTRIVSFQIEIAPPEAYVYSNVSSVSISPWDMSINFADVRPEIGTPDVKSKAIVGVVMPPEHAAGLVLLLMEQLRNYEKQFGPVRHAKWRQTMETAASRQAKHASTPPATEG